MPDNTAFKAPNEPVETSAAVEGVATATQAQEQPQKVPSELDARFAQLARKEKALRIQARKLQDQQKAWEEAQKPKIDPDAWKSRLKQDPLSVFTEAGVSQEELINLLTYSQPQDIELRRLKAELAELKASQAGILGKVEEGQKSAINQALKQVRFEVGNLTKDNENYETINAQGAHEAVVELIRQTYEEQGVLLSTEEAARDVEEYLLEEAINLAKLKKVQSKLAPPVATQQAPKTPPSPQIQTTPRTLTNAVTQASTNSSMSRRERAIAAFQGKLGN